MTIKFRYHSNVNHAKITVFAGPDKAHLVNCGQLTMLHGEWLAMVGALDMSGTNATEIVLEEEKP